MTQQIDRDVTHYVLSTMLLNDGASLTGHEGSVGLHTIGCGPTQVWPCFDPWPSFLTGEIGQVTCKKCKQARKYLEEKEKDESWRRRHHPSFSDKMRAWNAPLYVPVVGGVVLLLLGYLLKGLFA